MTSVQDLQERPASTSTVSNRYQSAAAGGSTRALPVESRSPPPPPPPVLKHGPQRDVAGRRDSELVTVAAAQAVDTSRSGQPSILRPKAAPRRQSLLPSTSLQTAQPWPQGHRGEVGTDEGLSGTQERADELASFGYICYGRDHGAGSPSLKDRGAGGGGGGGVRGVFGGGDGGGGGGEDSGGQRPRSQSQSRVLSC